MMGPEGGGDVDPRAELLDLPKEYGTPKVPMAWTDAREILAEAHHYWFATVRPDGRPHLVPRDGLWVDDALYYGGGPETVHARNVAANPAVAFHVGTGLTAVIVEGEGGQAEVDRALAERLAEAQGKYRDYGYPQDPEMFLQGGVLTVRPRRALAWTSYPKDCTRFRFD
jgi:pyridoxamine 5'-phosphate oxidase-like protein